MALKGPDFFPLPLPPRSRMSRVLCVGWVNRLGIYEWCHYSAVLCFITKNYGKLRTLISGRVLWISLYFRISA